MQLTGARALVTGAQGGIGDAVCDELAKRGASVLTADVPGSGADLEADLLDPAGPATLAEAAGPIDVLVNNAGVEFAGAFTSHTAEELEAITRVNLLAPMELIRLVVPGMVERGRGHVVNMASLAGRISSAWLSSYNATKHGLVGLTHSLRAEYASAPVGFSVICPGFISDAGMYGRHEDAVEVPRLLGSLAPSKVGDAVARAIEKDKAEVIVNARPVRPVIALAAVAPDAVGRINERIGTNEAWRRIGQRKGRI